MTETVQIDHAGRLVLPKRLREHFRIEGGDSLTMEAKGDAIEIRPAKATARLIKVNGVLVLAGGEPLASGRDFVAESREERIKDLAQVGGGIGR